MFRDPAPIPENPRAFNLRFRLTNVGHAPARISVYGRIAPQSEEVYSEDHATKTCLAARKRPDKKFIWVVIPGFPIIDDVKVCLRDRIVRANSPGMETPDLYGCILYESTIGDSKIRQTPFVGRISMLGKDGQPPHPGERIPVDFSHGSIAPEKLCILDVLEIGPAK